MLRFIAKEIDYGPFAGGGEIPVETFKTLDIAIPELEAFLRDYPRSMVRVQFIGFEIQGNRASKEDQ